MKKCLREWLKAFPKIGNLDLWKLNSSPLKLLSYININPWTSKQGGKGTPP